MHLLPWQDAGGGGPGERTLAQFQPVLPGKILGYFVYVGC